MSKYICPLCGAELDSQFCQCSECGEYVEGEEPEREDWLFALGEDILTPDWD